MRQKFKNMNKEAENDEKIEKIYSIFWGKCTGTTKTKLKACEKYEDIIFAKDTTKLFKKKHLLQL